MKLTLSNKKSTETPKKYVRLVLTEDNKKYHRLVETKGGQLEYHLGVGKFKEVTPRQFSMVCRNIVQAAVSHQIEYLAVDYQKKSFTKLTEYGDTWMVTAMAENFLLAAYTYKKYKTTKSKDKEIQEILICGGMNKAEKQAFERAQTVATYVNHARDIANTPGDDMSPAQLALEAKKLARNTKVKTTVLSLSQIKKAGLHALIAVGKGATNQPRFIVMEYYGAGKPTKQGKSKQKQPIVLVGKGITYDTGGLNVKPSGSMHEMHMDMSGGSAVIAAVACAAKLTVKRNIVGIIPAAENAISGTAMRAGDIIKSHKGKTIEVLHTDAEGRLVLADGLSYAERYNPRVVLDVATLTGAALVALGQHTSAVMTEDSKLQADLVARGEQTGDRVWPLPLWDEYKVPLTQTRADVVNIHPQFSRYGGAIEGAAFLSFFAPKCPWAHIDIAPRMSATATDKLAKGSTGEPVRLLVNFLEKY